MSLNRGKIGKRRYIQAHVRPDDPMTQLLTQMYGTGGEVYDGVGEFWWKSIADMEQALGSPSAQEALEEWAGQEEAFVDFSRSHLWSGIDLVQVSPPGIIVAREASSLFKGYYVGSLKSSLPKAHAQYHWNMSSSTAGSSICLSLCPRNWTVDSSPHSG